MNILLVFVGGGVGSILRYLVQTLWGDLLGILAVNLVGSFLAGYLVSKYGANVEARLFLLVGLLGGFTTFSAFSLQVMDAPNTAKAVTYIVISVIGAVLLCQCGRWLGST